jgi:hypothetical protein
MGNPFVNTRISPDAEAVANSPPWLVNDRPIIFSSYSNYTSLCKFPSAFKVSHTFSTFLFVAPNINLPLLENSKSSTGSKFYLSPNIWKQPPTLKSNHLDTVSHNKRIYNNILNILVPYTGIITRSSQRFQSTWQKMDSCYTTLTS